MATPKATKKTATKKTITEQILADLAPQSQNWIDRIPENLRVELEDIKKNWRVHKIAASKTGLTRSIARVLQGRGYQVGKGSIERWLMDN
jgi:hypothetical protein